MKLRHPVIDRLTGMALAWGSFAWMRTLSYRGALPDPTIDPAADGFRGPAIYLFWHEYIPFLFYLRPHCRIAMLLSRHHDAEGLAHAARFMGFDTIRGSSNRGGAQALRDLFSKGRDMNLAITPDGPRGPRRVLAPGPIYVASRLQLPLVVLGMGYANCWRLPTWDRFAVPVPHTQAHVVASEFIYLPPELTRDEVEQHRLRIEGVLNELTEAAEAWARHGGAMSHQVYGQRQSMTRFHRRRFSQHRRRSSPPADSQTPSRRAA